MAKQIKTLSFSGGITDEFRDTRNNYFWYSENLDVGRQSNSVKQIVNTTTSTNDICILKMLEYNGVVYGIGFDNSSNKDTTLYQYINTGSSFNWTALTNGTVASTTLRLYEPAFAVYHGYIYFDAGNNYIARYKIDTTTMTATWSALTGGASGGVISPYNDKLYIWVSSSLYEIDGSTMVLTPLVLPTAQTIVDVVPYSSLLGVLCKPGTTNDDGVSRLFFWDFGSIKVNDVVDIGYGFVTGGDILDGTIYCTIGFPNGRGFRIKAYSGGQFITVYTYTGKRNLVSANNYCRPATQPKAYSGFLYFLMVGARPGSSDADVYEMVLMRYGRKSTNENNKMSVYKTLEVIPDPGNILGELGNDFIIVEDSTYASGKDQSVLATVYEASYKTRFVVSTTSTFSAQAGALETVSFTGDDISTDKSLIAFSTYCAALTSGQSVAVYYMQGNETSWTLMYTHSVVGETGHDCITVESSGDNLPSSWGEIRFRIQLLGGAELTGYKFKYNELNDVYGK